MHDTKILQFAIFYPRWSRNLKLDSNLFILKNPGTSKFAAPYHKKIMDNGQIAYKTTIILSALAKRCDYTWTIIYNLYSS